jgi:glucokinase
VTRQLALGIEIGGTKLQAGIGNERAGLLSLVRRTVDAGAGAVGIRAALGGMVAEALVQANCRLEALAGCGIGFGGPYDTVRDLTLHSFQIEGWDEFPLRAWAEAQWALPAVVRNDAAVAGLAEARHGAGRGFRRVFYMTIGSGIGGGWIVEGRIDVGQGLGAAEIGHTWVQSPETGEPAELEQICSGWAIGRRASAAARRTASSMLEISPTHAAIDAKTVYTAAVAGDPVALAVLRTTCETLGLAIANVIALLHPEVVVIGGGVSLMGPLFWEMLRTQVRKRTLSPFVGSVQVVPAQLQETVVVAGAIDLVLAQRAG